MLVDALDDLAINALAPEAGFVCDRALNCSGLRSREGIQRKGVVGANHERNRQTPSGVTLTL
jgi:hypothetical protein